MKKKLTLLLIFSISILQGCNFNQGINSDSSSTQHPICKELSWSRIKAEFASDTAINEEDLEKLNNYISSCTIKTNEVNDIISIYREQKQEKKRIEILSILNKNPQLIQNNSRLLDLYKSVAASDETSLITVAIQGLATINKIDEIIEIYNSEKDDKIRFAILGGLTESLPQYTKVLELYESVATSQNRLLAAKALRELTNAPDDERWTTWGWSNKVKETLEEAVEKDFDKLSLLDNLELLALANKYPNSRFTKACIEYRSFTEGSYFGQGIGGGWGSNKEAIFRQPFNPEREINFWPKFLAKYPGHPGSDDAMYRLARAYEMKGDYDTAIRWYYKAYQAPDGSLRNAARDRMLFIIDLLMSSDALTKFLQQHPDHPLYPYILYSRAVYLVREDRLEVALSEMAKFIQTYKDSTDIDLGVLDPYISSYEDYQQQKTITTEFWSNVQEQFMRWKKIAEIRNKNRNDESLYEEAAFWFHYQYLGYNHLWNGGLGGIYEGNIPEKWEGATTSIERSITYKLVQNVNRGYELQNRHLRSIRLFEKLLKDFPNSDLAAKAKYSIGLNYYYLYYGNYPQPYGQNLSWSDMIIKTYKDFVRDFPDSSMADDALLTIAEMEMGDKESKESVVQTLEKVLKNYPTGDRYTQAETMLNQLRGQAPSQNKSTSPVIGIGIKIKKLEAGNGVLIEDTLPNLPARQAGLQSGDIILQVDGQYVASPDDVTSIIRRHQPGETVRLEIERQGQKLLVEVVVKLISL
ncbi:MAG: PDZ domain-containing protein [Spirirestis rafaelensis WJT71-NPBG6]|jgi:TolA-binding protein|nr:PDZ domain-containing protein [Spirirestis rafaelensis WJT71-NPBG6]